MAIVTGTDGGDKDPLEPEGTNAADGILGLAGGGTLLGFGGEGNGAADFFYGDQVFGGAAVAGTGAAADLAAGAATGGGPSGSDRLTGVENSPARLTTTGSPATPGPTARTATRAPTSWWSGAGCSSAGIPLRGTGALGPGKALNCQ